MTIIDEDLKDLLFKIKEKREKDGYKVKHKSTNKFTLEEVVAKMIKSHT